MDKKTDPYKLLTAAQAAEYLALSLDTLQRWRDNHVGPPHYKLGGAVRYDMDELHAWLRAQRRKGA